ncbi:uncharacterized protein LOC114780393 isoform X2 [Denticeps clupeoides]|uniref:uncharacterized protein LOC114780393 isoform X2 n=1 Tax=Denticeps clupeoides TaxID=299321 RepID=UPI0010A47FF3|nr:uncharacterized protein LOC114780393 isoform X2 [Denticeps clupeoides]
MHFPARSLSLLVLNKAEQASAWTPAEGPGSPSAAASVKMAYQTFQQEYLQIPVVTRAYTTACVLTTAAVQLEIITPFQLYFNPDLILNRYQVWRLITNFLFFGPVGFNFLFNMIFLYRYCRMLEEGSFRGRTADFVFMFLFGGLLMTVSFSQAASFLFVAELRRVLSAELNDSSDIWNFCESGFPGPGVYHHAGVRLEQTQPQRAHELLRPAQFPSPLPAVGAHGLLAALGQLHHSGSPGHRRGTRVLLPGGRLPQPARWQQVAEDPLHSQDAVRHPGGRRQLQPSPRGPARRLRLGRRPASGGLSCSPAHSYRLWLASLLGAPSPTCFSRAV